MTLIAGPLHEDRDPEAFQLFLDLRGMVDHRGFHCKLTGAAYDRFVIRCAVLSCIGNLSLFHRSFRLRKVPSGLLCPGKCNGIQGIQADKIIHGGGRHKIDIFYRFMKDRDRSRKSVRRGHTFRQQEKLIRIPDGDEGDAVLIIVC